SLRGVDIAAQKLKALGQRNQVIPLSVGGAFHSPLMQSAEKVLTQAIQEAEMRPPICPIYQNYSARPHQDDIDLIKENLIKQLTAPVKWSQSITAMLKSGLHSFEECGPGEVLTRLLKKIRNQYQQEKTS
ncbi:MAG: [acyl-carrier-protein] S-malonyltransferase, partial [Cytophagales bacterium]|nr:[acyl-carrier-protein] S-malonyltransferase [Cytophagales bacterium]